MDKFLKVPRFIKRRAAASEACGAGRVLVNDKLTKASVSVKIGNIIEIQFGAKAVRVEVLDVREIVKKDEAKELYRYIQRQLALDVLAVIILKINGIEQPISPYI